MLKVIVINPKNMRIENDAVLLTEYIGGNDDGTINVFSAILDDNRDYDKAIETLHLNNATISQDCMRFPVENVLISEKIGK